MISCVLQVGILIQHSVVGVQEKVKRVLVQEVHLEQGAKKVSMVLKSDWKLTSQ